MSRSGGTVLLRFTANARFKVLASGKLRLPKIGEVPVRWSRPLPSEPFGVTVIRDPAGRYFASFAVETEPDALPAAEQATGIDLGLKHFAVLSDGTKIASPRFLRRAEKTLRRAQRALSRKEKGSRNRERARVKVARAHATVADARRDFCHQLSTALIRENQAVAVENLAVKGLARTRMAKSVHGAGWSGFVAMLEYKARLHGRAFHRTGRFVPTSQTCSACGVRLPHTRSCRRVPVNLTQVRPAVPRRGRPLRPGRPAGSSSTEPAAAPRWRPSTGVST